MFGVETIGNYDVRKLSDGRYSIALNNGNIGARIGTEADVQALRDKYNGKTDTFERADKPKMSQEEAHKIIAMASIPIYNAFVISSPLYKEAMEAYHYYATGKTSGFDLKDLEKIRQESARDFQKELVYRNGGVDKVLSSTWIKWTAPVLYKTALEMKQNNEV